MLSREQLDSFAKEGFVKVERAFPRDLADQARAILWKDTGCDPHDKTTWTRPVIRLGMYSHTPFVEAANTPVLHEAFDQLVGAGKWLPCMSMGTRADSSWLAAAIHGAAAVVASWRLMG